MRQVRALRETPTGPLLHHNADERGFVHAPYKAVRTGAAAAAVVAPGAKPTDNNQLIPRRYLRKLQQLLKVDADAVVARTTAARWASFAKAGDPNYEVGR